MQNRVRHTRSTQASHTALVEVAKKSVVGEVEVVWDGRESQAREGEIDVDARDGALDDGNKGVGHGLQSLD